MLSKKAKTLNLMIDIILVSLLFIFSYNNFMTMYNDIDLKEYIGNQLDSNTIYEDYYSDPKLVNLSFPSKGPNLIHIILESIETTYTSKESGGAYDYNLIPNLTEIANNNVSFSTSDKLTGGFISSGTAFTVGSLVAQTSGVPLTLSIDVNGYSGYGNFLPCSISI